MRVGMLPPSCFENWIGTEVKSKDDSARESQDQDVSKKWRKKHSDCHGCYA